MSKQKTTRKAAVLAYLRSGKRLTPMTAWNKFGLYRLGSTINKLRDEGKNIKTTKVKIFNRFGRKMYVASYSMKTRKAA